MDWQGMFNLLASILMLIILIVLVLYVVKHMG